MLKEFFFFNKIKEEDISNIQFQQDGATYHVAEAALNVLRLVFEYPIISRKSDIIWPPRSCDLTSLDQYQWGTVKDNCYADNPEAIDALKNNIREVIGKIQLHTIDNVLKNLTDWKDCTFKLKKKFEKIFSGFLKAFTKKKLFGGACRY